MPYEKTGVDGWNVLGPDLPLALDSRHVQDWTSGVSSQYHNYTSSIGNEPSTFCVEYANQIDSIQVTQTLMTPTGLLQDIDPETFLLHCTLLRRTTSAHASFRKSDFGGPVCTILAMMPVLRFLNNPVPVFTTPVAAILCATVCIPSTRSLMGSVMVARRVLTCKVPSSTS